MEDLISRRTIIDGLEFVIEHGIETDGAHSISAEKMLEFVRELPTVQPNIVRCKDCQYWNNGSCEYPEYAVNSQDYWVGDIETEAEHFCGYADGREVTT